MEKIDLEYLTASIPKDIFYNYYIVENHTKEECKKYFNINNFKLNTLIKYYNIVKSKPKNLYLNTIKKEDIIEYYINQKHTIIETAKYFNTYIDNIIKICKEYRIIKNKKPKEKLKNCRNRIDKEELYKYYIEENHTYYDTLKHFDVTEWSFTKLCNEYGIKKPKEKYNKIKKETYQSRYGVEWGCLTTNCLKNYKGARISKSNIKFASLLESKGLIKDKDFNLEYIIGSKGYDLKIGNNLIEINPSATHNINFSPFAQDRVKDKNYHLNKTRIAEENGYRCIHIFDWDDWDKIVDSLIIKDYNYARKCNIKIVDKLECDNFINENHFQGTCNGQTIRLGLYSKDKDELLQVMTFGKPRYNKNYEYELVRLCTKNNSIVVGGAERLFKYFINNYNPSSIISYCDRSKFKGNIYTKLGFNNLRLNPPTKHWFNIKTKQHILNSLLVQRGYDQLFNTNYGKGIDNNKLMKEHGFVEIYDCGQAVYEWRKYEYN